MQFNAGTEAVGKDPNAMTRALVFDSGVGGLTIASEIRRAAPGWTVDYAADSGFFPYGVKSDEELRGRLPGLVRGAGRHRAAGSPGDRLQYGLDPVDPRHSRGGDVPVVGTVPAIKPAADLTKTGVIGVLGTPGTVRRAYLDDLEREFAAGKTIIRRGSAGLVDVAERHVRGSRSITRRWLMRSSRCSTGPMARGSMSSFWPARIFH